MGSTCWVICSFSYSLSIVFNNSTSSSKPIPEAQSNLHVRLYSHLLPPKESSSWRQRDFLIFFLVGFNLVRDPRVATTQQSDGPVDHAKRLPLHFWYKSCLCQLCVFATIFSKLCAFPVLLTIAEFLSSDPIRYSPGIVGKCPPATLLVPLDSSTVCLSINSDTNYRPLCILMSPGEKEHLLTCL